MANIDMDDYEMGKEARKNMLSYLKYVIVGLILVVLEIVFTGWWTLLLGPLTIALIVVIAMNRSAIRGFLGLNSKK